MGRPDSLYGPYLFSGLHDSALFSGRRFPH
jgi:hypothetical protein